ncbi:uncharacterized protein CANTADRAFT_7045 [Suhomyces tanzawaensis NRRL Y-17324]|uniref:Dolichyl-diphosphooligosaccharide-protein glycosyltransferase subunit OST5 n=1 Tax=Suhomyces tanzawaensis NRRL Y-17324 TaxID=984487 RepID=A0A1E4SGV0_9ASCO|nr:uncharacterized protein CANTADRAFT_7045 [Suhomyces tanzawaensis NRRL Y-17324]ODV78695.1 hypothetical protein CANTADRAFT_7045 [Suhomyces tanzawaensis NRRL Y-17324]
MSYGADYDEINKIFTFGSTPVEASAFTRNSAVVTAILLLIAFTSLTMTFMSDRKTKSPVVYLLQALVASLSVGFSTIYVSNFVGVYI